MKNKFDQNNLAYIFVGIPTLPLKTKKTECTFSQMDISLKGH